MSTALILIDHGSRRASANQELEHIARQCRNLGHPLCFAAHMELAEPTLCQAIRPAADCGASEIRIVPWFLALGKHLSEDIPQQIDEARRLFPHLVITQAPALKDYEGLAKAALSLAQIHT